MSKKLAKERYQKTTDEMVLFDDTLFSVVFEDKDACQELIRLITGNSSVIIIENKTQFTIKNLNKHSVILDLTAKDSNGIIYAVELQKRNEMNSEHRIRYNNSLYDSLLLDKGIDYNELPDVISIFISEFDVHNIGNPIYQINSTIDNTSFPYEEGRKIIFVNASNSDGSPISRLMDEFFNKGRISNEFINISERVRYLKETMGGAQIMCEKMETLAKEYAAIEHTETVKKMIQKGYPLTEIADLIPLSIEEIKQINNEMN